jgi:glycine/D-amino acid oxidase-like deaminating enzyme
MPQRARDVDLAVVGAGPVGLATAWRACAAGLRVAVLDRAALFNAAGGSGGAERQWRYQYSDAASARLVVAAAESWRRLEAAADRVLVHPTGSLWFGDVEHDTNEGQIRAAAATLDEVGLGYTWMTAAEIEKRFGFAGLRPEYEGFHQPDGGVIDVRGTLWALHALALATGRLELCERVAVRAVEAVGDRVRLDLGGSCLTADRCVVAAGGHTAQLLAPLGVRLRTKVFEMPSAYFRVRGPQVDFPTWFAFEPPTDQDPGLYYGFGRNPWAARGLVRVAPDSEAYPFASPDEATGRPRAEELGRLAAWVSRHLPDLDPEPVEPSTCLVSLPDEGDANFHLGRVPGAEQIAYCASGWIYKFVPLLGEVCLDLVLDGAPRADLAALLPLRPGSPEGSS